MKQRANEYANADNHLKLADPNAGDVVEYAFTGETITTGTLALSLVFDGETLPLVGTPPIEDGGEIDLRDAIFEALIATGKVYDVALTDIVLDYATGDLALSIKSPLVVTSLISAEGTHALAAV